MLTEPPALGVSIAIASVYFALLIAGIVLLRLRMFADAMVHGPAEASGVVLTFDGGPDPKATREVLDVLDAHDVKAAFFVAGREAEAHPELALEIVERGHELGLCGFAANRSFVLRGSKHVRADLERAIRVLENVTEKTPLFFRPPGGLTNPTIARIADQLDLTIVGWSTTPKNAHDVEDGAIVALREAGCLPGVLDAIASKNLRVVPLSTWS